MKSFFQKIQIETKKQFELIDITTQVQKIVADSHIKSGTVVVFCPHTTASIKLNHNETLLIQDIMKMLYRLIPVDINYSHDLFEVRQNITPNERSNGHAHVKSFLLGNSESLIIENFELLIGKAQSIFFVELDGSRIREVYVKAIGE